MLPYSSVSRTGGRLLFLVSLVLWPVATSVSDLTIQHVVGSEAFEQLVTQMRHHLHSIPEIKYQEYKTSAFVVEKLREFGVNNITKMVATGVVADLGMEGPMIALRAELDALPMEEPAGLSYRSTHAGAMHACGHDGNMAVLLGVAAVLGRQQHQMKGRVRLIFQPAEEGGAGAARMVQEGALQGVSHLIAVHVQPNMRAGVLAARPGLFRGAAMMFEAILAEHASPGSLHGRACSAVQAAARGVLSLQSDVAHQVAPLHSALVSVTKFETRGSTDGGGCQVTLGGTIRADSLELLEEMLRVACGALTDHVTLGKDHIKATCQRTGPTYPAVVNSEKTYELVRTAVSRVAAAGRQKNYAAEFRVGNVQLTSDDLSFMASEVDTCLVQLGQGDARLGTEVVNHNPHFKTNDRVLPLGVEFVLAAADSFFQQALAT